MKVFGLGVGLGREVTPGRWMGRDQGRLLLRLRGLGWEGKGTEAEMLRGERVWGRWRLEGGLSFRLRGVDIVKVARLWGVIDWLGSCDWWLRDSC